MKHISKRLNAYLGDHDVYVPVSFRNSDFKALAMEGSAQDGIKLTKLVLLAACNSPRREEVIQGLMSLSQSTQQEVISIIEECRQISDSDDYGSEHNSSPVDNGYKSGPAGDVDLLHEEQMGKITAENHKLLMENQDLMRECHDSNDRVEQLRQSHADLQSRLAKAEEKLGSDSAQSAAGGSGVKFLQTKIRNQEELIANQESQITGLEESLRSVQKRLDKSITASERAQQYKDERDEIAIERDDLRRKANTLDKYKQKLEASAALEKENVETRREVEELRRKFLIADKERQRLSGLAIAVDEYERTLPRIEQDAHDLRNMKKQLEFDNAVLVQRCETTEEERDEDRKTIKLLKAQLQGFDASESPIIPQVSHDLDDELKVGDKGKQDSDQLSRLQRENGELRSTVTELEGKIAPLQKMLNSANRKSSEFDRRSADAAQEKSRLESLLASAQNNVPANKRRSSRLSSVSNADDIVSVEAFQTIKSQLIEERRLRVKAEADLTAPKESQPKSMFRGTLMDELSRFATNDDTGLETEPELGHEGDKELDDELLSALEAIRAATSKQAESDSDKRVLDQHIGSLADKVAGSRMRLLKQSEVNVFPQSSSSSLSIIPSGEQPRASRLSVASSLLFSKKSRSPTPGASCKPRMGAPNRSKIRQIDGSGSLEGYWTDSNLAGHPTVFITSPGKGKNKT